VFLRPAGRLDLSPVYREETVANVQTGKKQLGQYLLDKGLIDQDQLRAALDEQRRTGLYLREVFVKLGYVTDEDLMAYYEEELLIPSVKLLDYNVEDAIVKLIPEKLARRYRVVPLFLIKDNLTIAMEDPLNVLAIDDISAETGYDIEACVATRNSINIAIKRYYGTESKLDVFEKDLDPQKLEALSIDSQVIEFVEAMIKQAVDEHASDIHLEPDENLMRVRFRVDGILREVTTQPLVVHSAVVSRIKVLSELDIAERRLPQDGRFQTGTGDRVIDLRVSTFPTVHGENVVLRLLDKKNAMIGMDQMGFEPDEKEKVESLIQKPNGIILVTGPTGSGKTTTLYAALQKINKPDLNIQTLEDPVEYLLPMIRQTQVNEEIGLTFARGLRALVRQDPDVIMVGEIRDQESAEIAIRSSLTGHLVLSTVHTNDAVGALARLIDMGIDPFLLASSLLGVIAQRLVRRICERCKGECEVPRQTLETLEVALDGSETWYRGEGCDWCGHSGYKGRVGIYEILEITSDLRRAILEGETFERVREIARRGGSRSLRDSALSKARGGLTTVEEVIRVTKLDSQEAGSVEAQEDLETPVA
jgi:type IV pilus assembly protein PilB